MHNFFGAPKKCRVISPAEVKELLGSGRRVHLIDVRTPEEYSSAHIPGSILLPLDGIAQGIGRLAAGKDDKIIVYCRSGARAEKACAELMGMGYSDVSSLGGMIDWPYETVSGD
jgi:phage shock protein E